MKLSKINKTNFLFFLVLFSPLVLCQTIYDSLSLFPDTTYFKNETMYVTGNITNAAIKFHTQSENGCTVEKIWFRLGRSEGDTNTYYAWYVISIGDIPEETILFESNYILVTIDPPAWQEIDVPKVAINNRNDFFISRYIPFISSISNEISYTIPNEYLFFSDLGQWYDNILPFYWAIKVLVSHDLSSVGDLYTPEMYLTNYPNPFNPSTTIEFEIPQRSKVKISIFNFVGERIEEVLNSELERGKYNLLYDARHLTSGIYFYRMETSTRYITRKMIYIK